MAYATGSIASRTQTLHSVETAGHGRRCVRGSIPCSSARERPRLIRNGMIRNPQSRRFPEGEEEQSPGSVRRRRTPPWGACHPVAPNPVRVVRARPHCRTPTGFAFVGRTRYPGCAARPWAKLSNAFGGAAISRQQSAVSPPDHRSPRYEANTREVVYACGRPVPRGDGVRP